VGGGGALLSTRESARFAAALLCIREVRHPPYAQQGAFLSRYCATSLLWRAVGATPRHVKSNVRALCPKLLRMKYIVDSPPRHLSERPEQKPKQEPEQKNNHYKPNAKHPFSAGPRFKRFSRFPNSAEYLFESTHFPNPLSFCPDFTARRGLSRILRLALELFHVKHLPLSS
jgi:hypothetical protein